MKTNEFDRIIGYHETKRELAQIADCLQNSERYTALGVHPPRGLLLFGVPGVGKSLMADCLIKASGRRTVVCRKTGSGEKFSDTIKDAFDRAVSIAPSVILLDDLDKFGRGDADDGEFSAVQASIDECRDKDVFVIATVNRMQVLPKSLLRPGRFDRRIEVCPPEDEDAVAIIAHYLQNKPGSETLDPVAIAKVMPGKSCAELETVMNEAALYAGYDRAPAITMRHFFKAALRVVYHIAENDLPEGDLFSLPDVRSHLRDGEHITVQVVYHEAGHAVISELLHPGSVAMATLHGSQRIGEISGFVIRKVNYVIPRDKIDSDILISLGGKAALDQKFGMADLGIADDLDRCYRNIREVITHICPENFHLHGDPDYDDSEDMNRRQEAAMATGMERYYRRVKRLLALNMPFLDKVAAALAEKHLLTGDDIRTIRESCEILL